MDRDRRAIAEANLLSVAGQELALTCPAGKSPGFGPPIMDLCARGHSAQFENRRDEMQSCSADPPGMFQSRSQCSCRFCGTAIWHGNGIRYSDIVID